MKWNVSSLALREVLKSKFERITSVLNSWKKNMTIYVSTKVISLKYFVKIATENHFVKKPSKSHRNFRSWIFQKFILNHIWEKVFMICMTFTSFNLFYIVSFLALAKIIYKMMQIILFPKEANEGVYFEIRSSKSHATFDFEIIPWNI